MPYLPILIIFLCAVFYHRAAKFEGESPVIWPGLSLLISGLTWFVFKWGLVGSLVAQVGLFAAITAVRVLRKKWQYTREVRTLIVVVLEGFEHGVTV